MPRPRKKTHVEVETLELTAIAKAEDLGLAEDCLRLLKENDIPFQLDSREGRKGPENITIKVAANRFNEAYMLIQSKISVEGFFDIYTDPQETKKDPNKAA